MKPGAETGRTGRAITRELALKTAQPVELVDITGEVERVVAASGISSGICYLTVPHTTAGILINENDDPEVARDIEAALDRLAPSGAAYRHREGNADAHIKSAVVGASQVVFIENGRLALGRWQGIFFGEFDGPRQRRVRLKLVADPGE
ncbi:MAG TPA: secondary thiamine-phosphate synthase enzyme YjbQ [Candidatus Acidoferrales bacterium]|nr:secondary thiamine-phosphate synthase enzyme YjbQ [Candidatus Acidoferrales bacterium]